MASENIIMDAAQHVRALATLLDFDPSKLMIVIPRIGWKDFVRHVQQDVLMGTYVLGPSQNWVQLRNVYFVPSTD